MSGTSCKADTLPLHFIGHPAFPFREKFPQFGRKIEVNNGNFVHPKVVIYLPKMKTMKKILALALLLILLYSCNRSVTPYQAATNHYNIAGA